MTERGEEPARQPKDPASPTADPAASSREPTNAMPSDAMLVDSLVRITADAARANGLPPLDFSLDFRATAFTVMPFAEGSYLRASGPPGGPLFLIASAITTRAEFGPGEGASDSVVEQVELLGEQRRAVAWISGSSHARTSHCSFVVAPPQGEQALLIEIGVGHQGPEVTCKTALGHEPLAKVLASLRFE